MLTIKSGLRISWQAHGKGKALAQARRSGAAICYALAAILLPAIAAEAESLPPEASSASVPASQNTAAAAIAGPPSPWEFNWSFLPLPVLITVAGGAELAHTPGPLDQYAFGQVAWDWYGRDVFDPTTTSLYTPAGKPAAIASYGNTGGGLTPFFDARAGWGLNLSRQIRVYALSHYMASNIEPNGSTWLAHLLNLPGGLDHYYDPEALVDGPIITVGPHLDLKFTDETAFPTDGWQGRIAGDFGLHQLGNRTKSGRPNDFALYRAQAIRYFPVGRGKDQTVVAQVTGGLGRGDIPVYERFSAGGTTYLRGYLSDRFAGNELLVGSLEWRHAAWPNLFGGGVGLSYAAYLDYGRAWETQFVSCPACAGSKPIAFPQDLRLGAGAGLGLLVGRTTLGRLDLMLGDEGMPFYPLFSAPLTWQVVMPGVGLSFSETW